jgi:hypothetical protein
MPSIILAAADSADAVTLSDYGIFAVYENGREVLPDGKPVPCLD